MDPSPPHETTAHDGVDQIARRVNSSGYARFRSQALTSPQRQAVLAHWDELPLDRYLRNGDRFRCRRYGHLAVAPCDDRLERAPYAPYVEEHNDYVGDQVVRAFPDLTDELYGSRELRRLIAEDLAIVRSVVGEPAGFRIGVHAIRVRADDRVGEPTPEGIHRDENDYFAVHLLQRRCLGGRSRIYDLDRRQIDEFALLSPLDSMIVDDAAVLHDVTPIERQWRGADGLRDVLVVDFYRQLRASRAGLSHAKNGPARSSW